MPTSRSRVLRSSGFVAAAAVMVSACGSPGTAADSSDEFSSASSDFNGDVLSEFSDSQGNPIPALSVDVPDGPVDSMLATDLDLLFGNLVNADNIDTIDRIGQSGDVRAAWLLTDMLRFVRGGAQSDAITRAFGNLTGTELANDASSWGTSTDRMIAWDVPALPGYVDWKRQLFELREPGWAPFFDDAEATIDWRIVSWGGVLIDDRGFSEITEPCPEGCIPALNDPEVTDAAGGDWYPNDRIVFGVTIDGESRAYPKHQMEVHEMINDTLGDRRIGIPYCTLCGSAQAYLTDEVRIDDDLTSASDALGNSTDRDTLELRTSGLLSRSNKVMFEFNTRSVFDTFTGDAVTGPLREAGVSLDQVSVVTTTWGDWKAQHPDTTILAEDGGLGRSYSLDPLRGRDDNGPIFPIGDVDSRLGVQDSVVGVIAPDGTPIAFDADAARDALANGDTVEFSGIEIVPDGAGLIAQTADGDPIASHQAFWFAWSQFHTDTLLWL